MTTVALLIAATAPTSKQNRRIIKRNQQLQRNFLMHFQEATIILTTAKNTQFASNLSLQKQTE
jgi:hypothetical protein